MTPSRSPIVALVSVVLFGCADRPTIVEQPRLEWSRTFGGDGNARITKAVMDGEGASIVTGTFTGELRLDDSSTLVSEGDSDVFVAKLDALGNVLWAKSVGSPDRDRGASVGTDAEGNVWITGDASNGVALGDGPLSGPAASSVFLARLDSNGELSFGRIFGGGSYNAGNDVLVGQDGQVFVTGSFASGIDFGCGSLQAEGSSDVFIARFDPDGACMVSRAFGDVDVQVGTSLAATPESDVVLLGRLGGEVDFGGGPLSGTSGGDRTLFVSKFDSRLNHIWSATALSSGASALQGDRHSHDARPMSCHSIAAQTGERTVLVGAGGTDFAMKGQDFEAPILDTAVLQQFSRYGETLVEGPIAGGGTQDEGAVAADRAGRVFVAGSFLGSLEFGLASPLVSEGGRDVFVAELDEDGAYLSSVRFGDESHSEVAWTVAAGDGNVVVGGWVRPNDTFGVDRPLLLKFSF